MSKHFNDERSGCGILVVGAHPDDAIRGAGGYLLGAADAGHQVLVLTLTSGSLGGDPDCREGEEQAAIDALGGQLEFGRLPDGDVSLRAAIALIERIVADVRPALVLTHDPSDTHQDHRAVAHATMTACRQVPCLMTYEGPSSVGFVPTVTIDVSAAWPRKLALLAMYRSQMETRPLIAWADTTARYRAWPRHVGGCAEGFRVVHSEQIALKPPGATRFIPAEASRLDELIAAR